MKFITIIFVSVLIATTFVSSKTLPDFIQPCKRNDINLNQCIINTFNDIRPYLKQGIPELEIPPGEPLSYLNATATTGEGSVQLKGRAWNMEINGALDGNVKQVNIDLDNARCTVVLEFSHVRLQGNYQFDGRIMLFQLNTNGTFDINATDFTSNGELFGKYYTKEGKEYIEFEKVKLDLKMEKATVYFTNLINGNQELSEILNAAINDNIESIMDEVNPVVGETFGGITRQYFNNFFRLFTVDELFPRD